MSRPTLSPNLEESIVSIWLSHMGYSNISDLSVNHQDPPDFVIDGNVGVEVRRLHLVSYSDGSHRTQEGLEHAVQFAALRALKESRNPPNDYTVEVSCNLLTQESPESSVARSIVKRETNQYLTKLNGTIQSNSPLPIYRTEPEHGITLKFCAFQSPGECRFALTQVDASARHGWIISDLIEGINHGIKSKTLTASIVAGAYAQYWLILVDHNTNLPHSSDVAMWDEIRAGINVPPPWSKVIVLSSHSQYDHISLTEP